jgi:biotin carboxyl carrier protein
MKFEIEIGAVTHSVEIDAPSDGSLRVRLDGSPVTAAPVEIAQDTFSILLDNFSFEACVTDDGSEEGLLVRCAGTEFRAQVRDPRSWRSGRHQVLEAAGPQRVLAPMPGKVVRVLVAPGEEVEAGRGLIVVEAMKMQNEIRAPKSGKIERVLVVEGQAVRTQEALLIIA